MEISEDFKLARSSIMGWNILEPLVTWLFLQLFCLRTWAQILIARFSFIQLIDLDTPWLSSRVTVAPLDFENLALRICVQLLSHESIRILPHVDLAQWFSFIQKKPYFIIWHNEYLGHAQLMDLINAICMNLPWCLLI